jgi:hypothetical protein
MPATTKTTKKTTRKPAAKKTAAKPAAKKTETKAAETKHGVPAFDEINERVDDIVIDAVKLMRDAAHTSIGMGLVVQDRLVHRDLSRISYQEFLDQAKSKGEVRMSRFQDRVEPIVQRFTDRIEPVTDRIESRLPEQMKDALDSGRERVRHVLAA